MNHLLAIPLSWRLALLFCLGAGLGSVLNLSVYRLAWHKRSISPWSPWDPSAVGAKRWIDYVPIAGWWFLRRHAPLHGRRFWIRPLAVELATGSAVAWLYWWEVGQRQLVTGLVSPLLAGNPASIVVPGGLLHAVFLAHVLLLGLMVVASLIDIDEKLIPDEVTIPGTLLALLLAAAIPWSLLPEVEAVPPAGQPTFGRPLMTTGGRVVTTRFGQPLSLRFLTSTGPRDWPASLAGAPRLASLAIGLGCYALWCFAVAPRSWYTRHGMRRAWQLFAARFARGLRTQLMRGLIVGGSAGVVALWWIGGPHWVGLLTALIGLVGGGGIVWAVRVIGSVALRKEAMGFGDVTLMMMIGAFVGWQSCLIIFFLAPFAGLAVGIVQWIFRRDQVIPYGPFLCLATVGLIATWADVWNATREIFMIGWLVPAVVGFCLVAMGLMLSLWRLVVSLCFDGR
ncbi:MAG: prepilin peptidase [Pirellulales bacterium]